MVGTADIEVATLAELPVNAPLLILKRSVFDVDDCLSMDSEGLHRSDFVRIRMRLR